MTNYKERLSPVKVSILGAANGLIVGLALEKARITFVNYQITQAAREQWAQRYAQTDHWGDFFYEAGWEPQVPLLSILVFAVVAYLIYEFFLNRPRLLLMIWFGLGIFALSVGYFMATLNPDRFSYLWLFGMVAAVCVVHQFWKKHPNSLPLLWAINGISAVIVGAVGIQLVGVFFWWPNARRPLIWLMVLVGVIAISAVFGAVVQFILNRISRWKFNRTNVQ
ncbi:MAG: hypothetical protein AABN95_14675 [Acidobacteriota bacterium]